MKMASHASTNYLLLKICISANYPIISSRATLQIVCIYNFACHRTTVARLCDRANDLYSTHTDMRLTCKLQTYTVVVYICYIIVYEWLESHSRRECADSHSNNTLVENKYCDNVAVFYKVTIMTEKQKHNMFIIAKSLIYSITKIKVIKVIVYNQ